MTRGRPGLRDHLIDKGREQESVGLKEGIGGDAILQIVYMNGRGTRPLNRSVIELKGRYDFRRAQCVSFYSSGRVDGWNELVQFRHKRCAFTDWAIDETQPAIHDMKCCSQSIVSIGSGDTLDLIVPFHSTQPLQAFPKDGFFVVQLF